MNKKQQEHQVELMMTNPFYCISQVSPIFTMEHPPLIDEVTFIKVGAKLIKEIGAERYLELLLQNLKSDFEPNEGIEVPDGYKI